MARDEGGLDHKRIGARPDQWAALDKWRAAQPDLPSRAAAVRAAIDMLTGAKDKPTDGQ